MHRRVTYTRQGLTDEVPHSTLHYIDSLPVEFDDGKVTAWDGGNLVRCRRAYATSTLKHKGGGYRGRCGGFNKACRRRLLRTTAKVKRDNLPLFFTFTYPGEFPTQPDIWKRDLDVWVKRLHRRCPSAGCIWRLEPQKRGAPHYHLLVWGLGDIDLEQLRSWASRSWYEVVGSQDERHLHAGTRVERVRSPRGVMAYAGKYLAKLPEDEAVNGIWSAGVGRWWGIRYPENIPWAAEVSIGVAEAVALRFMDALLAHAGLSDGSWRTVTVFGVGAEWLSWLHEISPPDCASPTV